eukprot:1180323-Prorocentrum_minimum.AAC.2
MIVSRLRLQVAAQADVPEAMVNVTDLSAGGRHPIAGAWVCDDLCHAYGPPVACDDCVTLASPRAAPSPLLPALVRLLLRPSPRFASASLLVICLGSSPRHFWSFASVRLRAAFEAPFPNRPSSKRLAHLI